MSLYSTKWLRRFKFKIIKLLTQWFWGKIQGKKNIQLFKSFCSFSNTKNFWKIYVQTKVWSLIKFLIYLAEFYVLLVVRLEITLLVTSQNWQSSRLMWNVKPVCIKTSSLHFFAGSLDIFAFIFSKVSLEAVVWEKEIILIFYKTA